MMRTRIALVLLLLVLSVGSSNRCGDGVTAFIISLEPTSSCASATRERAAERGFDARWHPGVRVDAETSWCARARARVFLAHARRRFAARGAHARASRARARAGRRPRARST